MSLNKPNNEIDTSTLAQESTSQEIKLSNESIKAVADEILAKIGLTTDAGGGTAEGSVFAKLNALLTQTVSAGGGIKRVQRGFYQSGGGSKRAPKEVTINIQTVNMEKSFLLLNGDFCVNKYLPSDDRNATYNIYGAITSPTTILIGGGQVYEYRDSTYYSKNVYWQVIEFN